MGGSGGVDRERELPSAHAHAHEPGSTQGVHFNASNRSGRGRWARGVGWALVKLRFMRQIKKSRFDAFKGPSLTSRAQYIPAGPPAVRGWF